MSNSLFGSTRPTFNQPNGYNFGTSTFGSSPPKQGLFEGVGSGSFGTSTSGRPAGHRGRTASGGGFRVPSASSDDGMDSDAEGEYEDDEDDEDDEMDEDEEEDGDEMDQDGDLELEQEHSSAQRWAKTQNRFSQSVASRTSASELEPGPALVRAGAKQTQFDLIALAKGLTPSAERATLHETDHVILESERLVEKVHDSLHSDSPEKRADVLGQVSQDLVALWQASAQSAGNNALSSNRLNASRLASLLLSIHHPPPIGHNQPKSALSLVPAQPDSQHYTPIPKVLLDWLNSEYSGVSEVDEVLTETRGYSMHPRFWEAVQATAVRGNFSQTLQLLQGAKLEYAETAQIDGLGDKGYSGAHLRFANDAVRAAIELVHECPAVASEDWDIKSHDWSIFRQRVNQAYVDLQEFAEGESASRHSVSQPFQASHFGISQSQASFHLSVASRKAESKVPWSVYESLRKLYQLLLGNEEEILIISGDWVEAVCGLAIWWNGEEEDLAQGSLAASRRSIMRSHRVRAVDVTPVKAYCQRMSSAMAAVIENSDDDFSVQTTNRFEVGLACVLDDNVEAALQILQGWSLTAASAVAELASAGGWFTRANGLMDQFDHSDLMVLSYTAQQPKGLLKDDLLIAYANLLSAKGKITSQNGQVTKEGWELAIQVLGRLDDGITASERIEQLLNELPLESAVRVDKITQLCHNLGLPQHALTIAEVRLFFQRNKCLLTIIEIC